MPSSMEHILHGGVALGLTATLFLVVPEVVHPHWDAVVAFFGGSRGVFVYGVTALHCLISLTLNSVFTLLYCTRPAFAEAWRIHARDWPWRVGSTPSATPFQHAPTRSLILHSLGLTLFNNLVVALPLAMLSHDYSLTVHGYSASRHSLPAPLTVMLSILLFMLVEDVAFYACHRTLHSVPWLYQHVHKLHHRYYYSLSYAAEFAHPLEFLLGNSLPFALGPTLAGAHAYTWLVWTTWRIAETIVNHSGYDIPFSPFRFIPFSGAAAAHDAHHSVNTGNYESFFNVLDRLFGTEIPEEVVARLTGRGKDAADDDAALKKA